MKSRQLWTRNLAFIIVVAVLGSLVTAGIVIGGSSVLTTKKYKKQTGIYASFKDGPVGTTPSLTQMASLSVPKGKYAINAKLYIENDVVGPNNKYQCQLTGGVVLDESRDGLGVDGGEKQATIALQGTLTLSGDGTIAVLCADDQAVGDNTDKAKFIKITAIRDRKITVTPSP